MKFIEGSFYHIYNRGNDKQNIFFQERNYYFFIEKIRKYIVHHADILAWCLMPNHFHLLVRANTDSLKVVREKPMPIVALSEGIRLLLSSYTKGIQKQEPFVGNLFQQKTKCKCADQYLNQVFHYIHQNPFRASLVKKIEDYPWVSFHEYLEIQSQTRLCNLDVAYRFLNLDKSRFVNDSYAVIPDDIMRLFEL